MTNKLRDEAATAKEIIDGYKADGGIINDEFNKWSSLEKRIENALLAFKGEDKIKDLTAQLEAEKQERTVEIRARKGRKLIVYALVSGDGYPWLSTFSCTDYWLPEKKKELEKDYPPSKFKIKKFKLEEL